MAIGVAATLVVGILPAQRLSRAGGDGGAIQLGRAMSDTPKARRLHHGLVVAEVALALTLLTDASVALRHE